MKLSYKLTAIAATLLVGTSVYANEPEPIKASYDKGYFVFGTDSKSFALKFDGRIMYDAGFVSSDKNGFVENNEIRRARFAIKTKFADEWAGEFDIDFAGNEAKIKDMWVSYSGFNNFEVKVGNHKPFFSIAEMTTSRWATFMETSMITDATGSGRRLGLSGSYSNNKDIFIGASIFGDGVGVNNRDPEDDDDVESGVHEKYSASFRAVYRPYVSADKSKLFHVGLNYLNLKPESDDGSKMRLKVGLENEVFDYEPLNTGKLKDVSEQVSQGVEFAGRYDKFMMQAEYIKNTFNRIESDDVDTDGFYIETAYMIWGSGRNYNLSDGEFGPVYPESKNGNLEVALRYSTIDLNDGDVLGGSSDNITLALNWYAHKNVVIRLNHTIADLDENADGNGDYIGGDDVSVTGLRIQYMF